MPAAATVLKSQCKRQHRAAGKIVFAKVTLCSNLAVTLQLSLNSQCVIVVIHTTNPLRVRRAPSGVTSPTKESEAPSPAHLGKTEAQKCEMASVTRGAYGSGGAQPSAPHTFNSARHRETLFTKSLRQPKSSQCPLFSILQKH